MPGSEGTSASTPQQLLSLPHCRCKGTQHFLTGPCVSWELSWSPQDCPANSRGQPVGPSPEVPPLQLIPLLGYLRVLWQHCGPPVPLCGMLCSPRGCSERLSCECRAQNQPLGPTGTAPALGTNSTHTRLSLREVRLEGWEHLGPDHSPASAFSGLEQVIQSLSLEGEYIVLWFAVMLQTLQQCFEGRRS